jgi:SAM-dependent methyltransferase
MSIKHKIKKAYHKLKYKGNRHQCPVCGFNAKTFMEAGLYVRRTNSKCPNCGSLERHRGLWIILDEILKEARSTFRILHFAPERCIALQLSKRSGIEYLTSSYGEDVTSDYQFDIQNIESKNDVFDVVICSHVLEHVDEDGLAMAEIYRILKRQGIALIQVPMWPSEAHPTYENKAITDPRDRIIHFGQFDHVRIYGLDVVERLRLAGFLVDIIDLEKELKQEEIDKYALHNSTNIRELTFRCTKP